MSTKYDEILFDVKDHVAKITFNRPEKMNAMTPHMEDELKAAFRVVQGDDDIRVLLLTGTGQRGFCSGMDVGKLVDLEGKAPPLKPGQTVPTPVPASNVARDMLSVVEKPVVAAVNGACAGAGLCCALASDIRIASTNARFVHVYLRRALVASGETWLLPRLVGLGPALYHILTADEIGPEEALRLNLVAKVVAPEKLEEESFAVASKLAAFDPTAMKFTKKAIRKSMTDDFDSIMEFVGYARKVANPSGAGLKAMEGFLGKK